MKRPKDGDTIDLSKKVETFAPPESDKKWVPTKGNTLTCEYGKGTPTPSPTLEEMAILDVKEYYSYLLEGSPEFERRKEEFLAKY